MSSLALLSVLVASPSVPVEAWKGSLGRSVAEVSRRLGAGKALVEGARQYRLAGGVTVVVEWHAGRAESFVFEFARKPRTWQEALARVGLKADGAKVERGERNSFGDRCAYVSGVRGLPKGWLAIFAEGKSNGWLAVQSPNFAAGW